MLTAPNFIEAASALGYDFYTGVPCSLLGSLINRVSSGTPATYVGAASEGEAVCIAAGAWLAGRKTIVLLQNSGLGNVVNPLTSLNAPFGIPTLLLVTWRGQPGSIDEPQHRVMGAITLDLLDLLGVEHQPLPKSGPAVAKALAVADLRMSRCGRPNAFVIKEGDFATEKFEVQPPLPLAERGRHHDLREGTSLPKRAEVISEFLASPHTSGLVVATTGKCSRELFTLSDRPEHFYQVGSMGGASGMALGLSLSTAARVFVLDGDGAALMKLGTLATIGTHAASNLVHIVLDNGIYDSTGGQPTAGKTDFAGVALACGYRHGICCDSLAGVGAALALTMREPGPTLIHARVAPGSMKSLGRPTVSPQDVAHRFREHVIGLNQMARVPV